MSAIIDFLNLILWEYVLVYGLLAVGIYFTVRLRLIQFLQFGEMFRVLKGGTSEDAAGISPIQALTVSLASRVGTGNIAGVAVALYLGGPGAIFWMWMVALVGMATAYSESALAQLYKVKNAEGRYRGGPAFYIARGLRAPWAGAAFSICLILSFGLVFNAVQANSIADAMEGAFGLPKLGVGIFVAILAAVVIFGGIRQIARVAELVVPLMAGAYLLTTLYVLVINWSEIPAVFGSIFAGAFGLQEAAGGVTGGVMAAMMNGVKRGLFSNEAGMGSAPNIAAVATPEPHHPSSQGFVQALGVFIDTHAPSLQRARSGKRPHRGATDAGGPSGTPRKLRILFHCNGHLLLRLHLDHRQLLLCRKRDDLPRRRIGYRTVHPAQRGPADGGLGCL